MRVDTRPRFEVNEKIVAKGFENEITIPYKGKALEKTFEKGTIVVGQLKNFGGQDIFSVSEYEAVNTIDKDTKKPYTGKAEFALDLTKGKVIKYGETTEPMSEPTKSSTPSTSKLFGAYNKNLILVVLAVAGYFAYKKFKK
jgi:hypothetical protein